MMLRLIVNGHILKIHPAVAWSFGPIDRGKNCGHRDVPTAVPLRWA